MSKKRGNGDGSVSLRKDGRWSAIITLGRSSSGKRVRKTVYGKTRQEVRDALTRLSNEKLNGTLTVRTKLTVAELIERWLTSWCDNLAPASRRRYREMARLHINPVLGGMDVTKLQTIHVRGLLDQMKAEGKGDRTRQYVFATIRRAMNLALNLDLITRSPCKRGMAPQAKSVPVNPPNDGQVSALLAAVVDSEWEAVFVLACCCGLRQGEIFALTWDAIDFDQRKLWVRHSLEELAGKLRIKEPKSASGRRVVKLPQSVVEALTDHRKRLMIAGKAASPYLFTDDDGGFLRKSNFQRRVWVPLKAAAGLSNETTFHDLRHAHASTLLRQNVHPKIVQERMGHSSIKLTMDTYSHLMPDAQDVAADAIDRVFVPGGRQLVVKSEKTA